MVSWLPALIFLSVLTTCNLAQADTCPQNSHWVRTFSRRAYVRADGTNVSASVVRAHCAANSKAFTFLNGKFKSGMPDVWEYRKTEKSKPWTDAEREEMIEAVSDLPESLWPANLKAIYRAGKSVSYPNAASTDNFGNTVIYDSAFSSKTSLAQIIAHEFSHHVYFGFDQRDSQSYQNAADWMVIGTRNDRPVWATARTSFVDPDGYMSVDEDFSNNIEYFLFNPTKVKELAPRVFSWIQTRYGSNFKIRKGP